MAVVKEKPMEKRVAELEFNDIRREQHYNELKKDVQNLNGNITKVLTALTGSGLDTNTGLIYDVGQIKAKQMAIEDKIEVLSNKNIEYSVYFKILGFVSGTLLISTITLIFKLFVK